MLQLCEVFEVVKETSQSRRSLGEYILHPTHMTPVAALLVGFVIVLFAGKGSKAALTSSDGETTVVKKVSFRRRRRGFLGNPWFPTVGAGVQLPGPLRQDRRPGQNVSLDPVGIRTAGR